MSFNKNNPNAMGKIMGYLKQLSTDMSGSEQQRRAQTDEERLYKSRGPKYARVPSKATLSASTTCTSLATSCGSSATLAPNIYATIPERGLCTESSSDDEQETFEKTRLHFQQLRQISLGNEYKYKMEMEIKSAKDENLRNSVPFVKQLSTDSVKAKGDYSINDDRPYGPTTERRYLRTQILAAFALSMGSLIVGFSSGYTSPALNSMRNSTLQITKEEESWVSGLMPLAAMVGGICGGPLIDYLGRRNTITAIAIPFFIGWMLIANANIVHLVLAGRALCGMCVGVGSLAFPVYLAEAIQREVRGILGLLPTAFGNIGILLCSIVGPVLDWSQLAFFGAALPIPFIILMLIIPESPNWYMSRGRVDDARKALQWLRGKEANVDREIRDIALSKAESDRAGGGLFQKKYIRSVAVTLGLMLFQQLSGINAVIFYTKDIFSEVGNSGINDNLSAIIIGLVNFSSTFLATVLIDRLGRKILLYISSISVIITLCSLGAYFYLKNLTTVDTSTIGWLPLASMIIYVLGFSLGFGPIPWLMMGEILPASIRGSAAALATAFNWTCTFIVTKTFPNIILSIGLHGTFWMFAGITTVGLFFVIFFVPETRGKSLEEIELKLTGGASRRVSSIANMKPLPNGC